MGFKKSSLNDCSKSLRLEKFFMPENDLQNCVDNLLEKPNDRFNSESTYLQVLID